MPRLLIPLAIHLLRQRGHGTGHSFIDSTSLLVCHPARVQQCRVIPVDAAAARRRLEAHMAASSRPAPIADSPLVVFARWREQDPASERLPFGVTWRQCLCRASPEAIELWRVDQARFLGALRFHRVEHARARALERPPPYCVTGAPVAVLTEDDTWC
jgi:hypothetical protein